MDEMNAVAMPSMGAEAGSGAAEAATVSPAEPATVFGFAPDDDGQAADNSSSFFQDDSQQNQGANEQEAAAPASDREQNAFAAQRRRYEQRIRDLENSPVNQIGERMVRDIMKQNDCSRDEAINEINHRLIKAYAERENIGEDAARMLMNMDAAQQFDEGPTLEEEAAAIVDDLMSVQPPAGFDMDAAVADEAFQQLLTEYPAEAAVRIYAAEQKASKAPQQVADMLRARQFVPQPTRPSGAVNPEPNFKSMSTDDFWSVKERYKKTLNI